MGEATTIREDVKELKGIMEDFREQYNFDMRGDTRLGNGNRGVIGSLRLLEQYNQVYPSFSYLLKQRTSKVFTIAATLFISLIVTVAIVHISLENPTVREWLLETLNLPMLLPCTSSG